MIDWLLLCYLEVLKYSPYLEYRSCVRSCWVTDALLRLAPELQAAEQVMQPNVLCNAILFPRGGSADLFLSKWS